MECAVVREERNPIFVYIRAVSDNENEKEQWNGKTMHVYARDFSVSARRNISSDKREIEMRARDGEPALMGAASNELD